MKQVEISIIVAVYGCGSCLETLYERLSKSLKKISPNFEIIFINDSSPDNSWEIIKYLGKLDKRVKGINFSRNFGQHYAISAGFDYAKGNWVVSMDCDLQDAPEEIPNLYKKAKEGYDIVYAKSKFRSNKNIISNIYRKIYFKLQDFLSQNKYETTNLSFYILKNIVRDNIVKYRESSRQISNIIREQGFNIIGLEVNHSERQDGKSSYTFFKRLNLAIVGLIAYPSILLKASFLIGFFISFLSFFSGIYLSIIKFFGKQSLDGWTSLITVILFSTGLILMFLGIVGMYIEQVFLEVKNRPLYIVKEELNTHLE